MRENERPIQGGSLCPIGIALFKIDRKKQTHLASLKGELLFSSRNPTIIIDDHLKAELTDSLEDLVVAGKFTDTDRCDLFEALAPELLGRYCQKATKKKGFTVS